MMKKEYLPVLGMHSTQKLVEIHNIYELADLADMVNVCEC